METRRGGHKSRQVEEEQQGDASLRRLEDRFRKVADMIGGTLEEVYNMQEEERNNLLELVNHQEDEEGSEEVADEDIEELLNTSDSNKFLSCCFISNQTSRMKNSSLN